MGSDKATRYIYCNWISLTEQAFWLFNEHHNRRNNSKCWRFPSSLC